ncbi:ImmA/IrrE family metallo-endopeptidase [Oceanobacillus kimchii]|uniref:ImmA/IrrE family metallo-endopeptidase n=1 Tax=Oceanobacillus kimchii TaxID=746691 RepID=UPI003B0154DE
MRYEGLLDEAYKLGIFVQEEPIKGKLKGLYSDNVIWIDKNLDNTKEKYCIMAEEMGHYHTSSGDILNQSKLSNRKQEVRARSWAYEEAVPLQKIVEAHKEFIRNKFELANFLDVTEEFLDQAILRYKEKYGDTVNLESYTICFEPLGVIEWFDK